MSLPEGPLEGVPEGPAATRCERCARVLWDDGHALNEAECSEPNGHVCRLAARLVEVERRAILAERLLEGREELRQQAESRASAAEGALRGLLSVPVLARLWDEVKVDGPVSEIGKRIIAARAVLSGLPPLADAPRVAPTTPAALVPKEEDK